MSEPHIIVVGAGLTGLSAGVLLARDGHRVTVLDRDPAPPPDGPERCWQGWARPGVNQFRQLHLMVPRWHQIVAAELPDVIDVLLELGGRRVNLLDLYPESATGSRRGADGQFLTVTARRPVLESALARVAQQVLTVRRGVRVTGLLTDIGAAGRPRVTGVRTATGATLTADLVVDAGGRRTPVPALLAQTGARAPHEERAPSGLVYYPRHYRDPDGRLPEGAGGVLTHHESFSTLTLPADNGTWAVALVGSASDRALRPLRDARAWEAAVRSTPEAAHWIDAEPITGVEPLGGLHDIRRSYVVDGAAVASGLVAVGDAWVATNPSLGRGAAIGLMTACVLRDAAAEVDDLGGLQFAQTYAAAVDRWVDPYVTATIGFGRHRLAEMEAEVAGEPYCPDGPEWPMTTALMTGARHDPDLLRAYARIGSMLGVPSDVLADADLQARLRPHLGSARYPDADCSRADLLTAINSSTLAA